MKNGKKLKMGKRTLLALAIVGTAVGIIIVSIVAVNYANFAGSGFYYNGVKIGGSTLSHEIDDDIYIIVVALFLVCSSLFLLLRVIRNK